MNWIELLNARFGENDSGNKTESTLEVNANEVENKTLETLLQHRTHRVFLDAPVDNDIVQKILACTFSMPSKSDLQQCSIVRICDAEKRRRLANLVPSMPWIGTCPEFFIFLADGRRITRLAEFRQKPFENDNADNFLAAVSDTGLAMGGFITAAQALGLGCCPISVLRDHIAELAKIIDAPKRVIPVAGMCLGYPARKGYISMRLPLSVTCHQDAYDDNNLCALIDDYDHRRDARFSIAPERQKYRKDYGTAAFYGWSEDKARQMSHPERSGVGAFIRKSGFSLK